MTTVPKQKWKYTCIKPQTGHVYVLDVNDGTTQLFIKFKVLSVSKGTVDLRWAFLNEKNASKFHAIQQPRLAGFGTNGTNGTCGGRHQEW